MTGISLERLLRLRYGVVGNTPMEIMDALDRLIGHDPVACREQKCSCPVCSKGVHGRCGIREDEQ